MCAIIKRLTFSSLLIFNVVLAMQMEDIAGIDQDTQEMMKEDQQENRVGSLIRSVISEINVDSASNAPVLHELENTTIVPQSENPISETIAHSKTETIHGQQVPVVDKNETSFLEIKNNNPALTETKSTATDINVSAKAVMPENTQKVTFLNTMQQWMHNNATTLGVVAAVVIVGGVAYVIYKSDHKYAIKIKQFVSKNRYPCAGVALAMVGATGCWWYGSAKK